MGISEKTIRDVYKISPSWIRCPHCGSEVLFVRIENSLMEGVMYCPHPSCDMKFFDIMDEFMADDKVIEKTNKMYYKMMEKTQANVEAKEIEEKE